MSPAAAFWWCMQSTYRYRRHSHLSRHATSHGVWLRFLEYLTTCLPILQLFEAQAGESAGLQCPGAFTSTRACDEVCIPRPVLLVAHADGLISETACHL